MHFYLFAKANSEETPTSSTWALAQDDVGGAAAVENYIVAEEGRLSAVSQVGPLPRISQTK